MTTSVEVSEVVEARLRSAEPSSSGGVEVFVLPAVGRARKTRLQIVLETGQVADAVVLSSEAGSCKHELQLLDSGKACSFDLNELNHAVQRFQSAELFEKARSGYCQSVVETKANVEGECCVGCLASSCGQ